MESAIPEPDVIRLLKSFTSSKTWKPHLKRPATRGDWTYATDGRVCIRAPRLDGFDGHEEFPATEILFERFKPGKRFRIERSELPKLRTKDCPACEGSGDHACNCEHCEEACEACDGEGTVNIVDYAILPYGRLAYLDNLRRIFAIPGPIEMTAADNVVTETICHFMFKIGPFEVITVTTHPPKEGEDALKVAIAATAIEEPAR